MNLQALFWSKNQSKEYKIVKYLSITIGASTIPLDVYIGFLLGEEKYLIAFPLIALTVIIAIVDSCMWAWVLEQMAKDKVEHGKKNSKYK